MLSRADVQNSLLELYPKPSYLEIGVAKGATFDAVRAARKVAVDPRFRFDADDASDQNPAATYHEVPSDVYFGEIIEPTEQFDVIYLDGLHTSEQTLRDFTNAAHYVTSTGVIIIDDIIPPSYAAALRDQSQARALRSATNSHRSGWMGDVYRLVFLLETFYQQYSFATVEENHGQLVVWRQRRRSVPARTIEAVGRTPYADVHLHRASFNVLPFDEIVTRVTAAIRRVAPAPTDGSSAHAGQL